MKHICFCKSEAHDMAFCHSVLPLLRCQGAANPITDAPEKHHAMVPPAMPAAALGTGSRLLQLLSWKILLVLLQLHLE